MADKEYTREEFVAQARKALGTPWVHQGRVVPHGVDCVGLFLWTLRQLGLNDYEPPPYSMRAKWDQFVGCFREHLEEVPIAEMRMSDVAIFRQDIYPCHCGIITELKDDPKFIHAYRPRGMVVEERYTPQWKIITRTAFRVPGVL